jgi:hypothetical protein
MGSYEITWPTRLTHDPKKRLTTELASQEAAGSDAFARERPAETPVTSAHEPSNVRDLKSGLCGHATGAYVRRRIDRVMYVSRK